MRLSVRCKDGQVTETVRTIAPRNFAPNAGRPMAGGDTVVVRLANERGMRQADLCAAMGCSQRALYNYTTRSAPVPTIYVFGLCDQLDVDPDEILDHDGFFKLDTNGGE